ncbi:MAG: hypothetical protein ACI7YS_02575 [Flavobacterium sp.]
MKFVAKILLIIFVAFLSTPTIVSLIEKKTDTSYFYSMSEEEKESHKDFKTEFIFHSPFELTVFSNPVSNLILSKNLLKHNTVSTTIFIPPPEQS